MLLGIAARESLSNLFAGLVLVMVAGCRTG
jgi:hypothetical protein